MPDLGEFNAFKEIGRTKLSVAGATITVSNLPSKETLYIIAHTIHGTASQSPIMRFNNDSGTNYSRRTSLNGAPDGVSVSDSNIEYAIQLDTNHLLEMLVTNVTAQEKLCIHHSMSRSTAGSGTAPQRFEAVSKWVNTTTQINRVDVLTTGGSFAAGSYVIILGLD